VFHLEAIISYHRPIVKVSDGIQVLENTQQKKIVEVSADLDNRANPCDSLSMLNHTTSPALISIATAAYEAAAKRLEAAARRCKDSVGGPLEDLYTMEMDEAFEAFNLAADDLRETRDGYRHTYPHPAALAPHGRRYPVG
jgi:hypothetical protein